MKYLPGHEETPRIDASKRFRMRKGDNPETDRVVDSTQVPILEEHGFAVVEEIEDIPAASAGTAAPEVK